MNKYDVAGLLQTYAEKIRKAPSKTSADLMISDLRRELPRRVEWNCELEGADEIVSRKKYESLVNLVDAQV